ncbi:putative ATPase/DNA-binding winged helix-turn-helix (wHTH) protein [Paraburkholderia bannensis]|uniref:Putative ATPase/DNA-binding winged helix-turn-helix (WHTH) protein n=1 Tax=Paraburkholderia bannensis TaxID=765414 RepID=A0A7W9U183_9BURK|nr:MULTISPECIES: winged helix-turn-helix domain-containing protein [Paraburkholderia]MBB3259947.1 putative ATPase/DNA-binding winged helix-turn-helix (wHTH) protein [Paraburkholderia sp. WP4_3_2]MBB6105153.1 putative ATPase/DNA-binding winged helix-turn-helix (wHTH) protein [Paraburkholderia bannensis]
MHQFERVTVSLASREVYLDGKPYSLSARAFDILALLIEADGRIVSKDAILDAVWPSTIVVDNNIQVHISALRKLLGGKHGWIRTVAGRGYRLAAPEERVPAKAAAPAPVLAAVPAPRDALWPSAVPRMPLIGRDDQLAGLLALLDTEPMLTLAGAGGVGKSALACELAYARSAGTGAGIRYIDFCAEIAHCAAQAVPPLPNFDQAAAARHTIFVVDGCECAIDEAAAFCHALSAAYPHARVVATSREPLRIAGERVYRVAPLALPPLEASEARLRASPAVQLFLRHVCAGETGNPMATPPLGMVASLCRLLDGLPLALELAARRAALIGVGPLLGQLDTQLLAMPNGLRGVPARQRTLGATLEWSHARLDAIEQTVLRRIALFEGAFDLDAATQLAACDRFDADLVIEGLSGLVSKSLLLAEPHEATAAMRYCLPRVTRAFALDKLAQADDARWLERANAAATRESAAFFAPLSSLPEKNTLLAIAA